MISLSKRFLQVQNILADYTYDNPFNLFIKDYFKKNKQAGRKDRNEITDIIYSYFRLSYLFENETFKNVLLNSHYILLFEIDNPKHQLYYEGLQYPLLEKIEDRMAFVGVLDKVITHFPNGQYITDGIDKEAFIKSTYHGLPLYLAIKKAKVNDVIEELVKSNISYEVVSEDSDVLRISKNFDIQSLETFSKGDFWVQDYSTHQSIQKFVTLKSKDVVWDVCAGAGGKSLAILNQQKDVDLYATDNRHAILENYSSRLKYHFNKNAKIYKADITDSVPEALPLFDVIVCDVPCSGSGTWVRTPERFFAFNYKTEIDIYQKRQLAILTNAIKKLKKGGTLYYITCSVFKAENEEVINSFISKNKAYQVIDTQYLEGSVTKSEYIFVSRISFL
jgi:16S rRNA (cytosine967-C5)-methyltransferase